MGEVKVEPPYLFFIQATKIAETAMITSIVESLMDQREIADLFSGCGAFSLAVAKEKKVTAYDNSAIMLQALEKASKNNYRLKSVKTITRNLLKTPLTVTELIQFDGVIVNPPLGGAYEQFKELAKSDVRRIVYISCNAETFARDSEILVLGGYKLDWVRIIDQFKWSRHIEIMSRFSKIYSS